jgi:two-component system sensor histidine kinase RstB
MFKAFFRLWLLVFAPIFFIILPHGYSPVTYINHSALTSYFSSIYSGTFYLLEKNLKATSPEQWQNQISQLSQEFGYELRLLPLQSAIDNSPSPQVLKENEFVFVNSEPELLLRRVEGSQWVLSMTLDASEQEVLSRNSQGSVSLIKREFKGVPAEQWPAILAELSAKFLFDLAILPKTELQLKQDEMFNLSNNKLVWTRRTDGQLLFYQQLPNPDFVLQAGAVEPEVSAPFIYLMFGIVFILLISIGMFCWVYPLWRDLGRLTATAVGFGNGYLEKRAQLAKTSVIARLVVSFNNMADRIEKLILGHRELTNAIAHDLRTPLYRLRFAFEMLDGDDVTKEEKQRYRLSISNSIDDLDHLINQTLVLSRYSQAMDISHFSECDLINIISEELQYYKLEHPTLTISFNDEQNLEGQPFFVDNQGMLRALNNLLSNASRYAQSRISVSFTVSEDNYALIVEDDGLGINEQKWEEVFQPFTQLESTQRGASSGHGLGLAIVQQIAIWHKGEVTINKSSLGGAKFIVSWPVKPA